MRTTLTLEPDVVKLLEQTVHRERKPLKRVVNEALRRGLSRSGSQAGRKRYKVTPHEAKLQPGLDPGDLNQLADELETDALASRAVKDRTES